MTLSDRERAELMTEKTGVTFGRAKSQSISSSGSMLDPITISERSS